MPIAYHTSYSNLSKDNMRMGAKEPAVIHSYSFAEEEGGGVAHYY